MHGLESHPNGTKVRTLREQGFTVRAPDLEVGLWRLDRRQSVLRHLLRLPELRLAAAAVVVAGIGGLAHPVVPAVGLVVVAGVAAARRRAWIAAAFARAFASSAAIAEAALRDEPPDVLVGSSWGGAVAGELVRRGAWSGPTVLLAPAAGRIAAWSGADLDGISRALRAAKGPVIVFHDPSDDVVPFADSVALTAGSTIELRAVSAGGHRLDELVRSGALAEALRQLA